MQKVLFIIDSLCVGGAEKSLVSLLPLLDERRYEVDLWIRSRGGVFEKLLPPNVKVLSQPQYTTKEELKLGMARLYFSLKFRILRLLGKKEHGAEVYWKCFGKFVKVPKGHWNTVIAYQQGVPTYMLVEKFHDCKKVAWVNCNVFAAGYDENYNCRYYRAIDKIVVVSEELRRIFTKRYIDFDCKVTTIYDIINPSVIKTQSAESVAEKDLFCNVEHVIVTVGRLVSQKNHLLAVEAAKIMKDKGVKFHWLFVGDGEERKNIEAKISECNLENEVFIIGQRVNPYAYMSKCSVYVQCSLFEGFGMTIAEAKMLGKPVVTTDFDVVRDQITDGVNGIITEMTPMSLANGIMQVLMDKKLQVRIVEALKKEVYSKHLTEIHKVEKLLS